MKLLLAIALMLTIVMWVSTQQPQAVHTYCGRHLARTLADLCWEAGVDKRSDAQYASYGSAWLMPYSEGRGKRGIVDECCLRPCSVDVLLSYC
uniref:Bombyxin A-7 n=1 Tax=Bombyx mori TaxID=7091 RepID=BXA7_BOMMO|nr:RecName: Full=Bombyxin A-7; Short=BBX-A7; AltName: Full=4K-prothoracicotropic hormone; Short=4K-PTTH; Contains: RecName: Full=Bombyxin A-7 B chain; Contains: RecName: Full=Bombyxin A-7 A chain; Flags: Precursor [Bombyx mori]BAA00668.1 bombyxin A-7 precursor [Bombyx mori]